MGSIFLYFSSAVRKILSPVDKISGYSSSAGGITFAKVYSLIEGVPISGFLPDPNLEVSLVCYDSLFI